MKTRNSFTFKDIKVNIEGNPVELGDIHFDNEIECSVQELAQSGSFIKDIIYQIRDAIKEAQASAQAYQPSCTSTPATTASASTPAKTAAIPKVAEPQKTEQHWDLAAVWSIMIAKLPDGFKKSGIGCYAFETGTIKDKNKITVKIEFNEDSIDMDIYVGSTAIHGYLYSEGERSRVSGINPALMQDMIEEMPEEIRDFVKEYFNKINK